MNESTIRLALDYGEEDLAWFFSAPDSAWIPQQIQLCTALLSTLKVDPSFDACAHTTMFRLPLHYEFSLISFSSTRYRFSIILGVFGLLLGFLIHESIIDCGFLVFLFLFFFLSFGVPAFTTLGLVYCPLSPVKYPFHSGMAPAAHSTSGSHLESSRTNFI